MCIRDRYQRRVHGKIQQKIFNQQDIIYFLLFNSSNLFEDFLILFYKQKKKIFQHYQINISKLIAIFTVKIKKEKNSINSSSQKMSILTPRSEKEASTIEIIPEKLYWISAKEIPNKNKDCIYIFSDQSHKYYSFNYDFGPLHLGEIYRFINKIESALRICEKNNTPICVLTGTNPEKSVNSALLMCSFLIISKKYSPEMAFQYFEPIHAQLTAYRDSTGDPVCHYQCDLIDCLRGLYFAFKLQWFNFGQFDVAEYEKLSQKGYGDINEILPGIYAFSGPLSQRPLNQMGNVYTPDDYIPMFNRYNIKLVIRLNPPQYDENIFKQNGIDHKDLIFEDGTAPSEEIIDQFLDYVENAQGAVAIHCKSGLGRTGTLIGMYAMKHYHISAADFIGWVRIVRPGSIHGPQQFNLLFQEQRMHNIGKESPIWKTIQQLEMKYHLWENQSKTSNTNNQFSYNYKLSSLLKEYETMKEKESTESNFKALMLQN
eukprot:TRINITY_DN554_c0_g3_i4.p1 TRINITY_DN554_c0_g3~~TRINITY_DN554_c0_g3_i4.p1  ORF type:complete len:495 (-),score=77.87 TRINITY_DN554_c0_g3_i4:389-1846(-)